MAHNKTFRPGEVAYGGLIHVTLNNRVIWVSFLDWNTKEPVVKKDFSTKGSRANIIRFVEENATYYWACKVVEWLDQKVLDANAFNMKDESWI